MKKITGIVVFITLFLAPVGAQNLGEYVYPFQTNRQEITISSIQEDAFLVELQKFYKFDYPHIDFQLRNKTESLGAYHYSFQILYLGLPIEQVWLNIAVNKRNLKVTFVQSNLPSKTEWQELTLIPSIIKNPTLIVLEKQLISVNKIQVEESRLDEYKLQFHLDNGSYFENDLKYHIDTTVYAKVFLPDPLSSANQTYGGNYQDGFRKDTSALVIQNIANSGGSTITANASTYNFDGSSFSIPTESYVNSFTGPTISQYFEDLFFDGQGNILGYNTAVTDNISSVNTELVFADYNYPELDNELVWQTMPAEFSIGEFKLQNDFFIISELSNPFTNPATSITDSFEFNRSQVSFEDVNVFFHLNNYKAHWENLGFSSLASSVILVDAHGNSGADNSFFSPTAPPRLIFGQGGVDDGEDADVIVHEYGHAISNFASPGSNVDSERRALDEGFGDYLSSSYSRQFNTINTFNVFSWDGHNEFWSGRISNSNKTREDISSSQNIYYNAEIWSSTLMDLYAKIGADNCDKLAIEVMFYNLPNTTISQAAENLFVADSSLFNGAFHCDIFEVLLDRKFLVGTCENHSTGIKDYAQNNNQVLLLNTYGFSHSNENIVISIKESNFQKGSFKVFDMNGSVVSFGDLVGKNTELDLNNLSPSIYFLDLQTNNASYRFKLEKNK